MSKLIYIPSGSKMAGDYDSWKLEGCDDGEIARTDHDNLFMALIWNGRKYLNSQAVPFAEAEAFLRQHCG